MISSSPNMMMKVEINLTYDGNCDWDWGHIGQKKTIIGCEEGYHDHLNQLYYNTRVSVEIIHKISVSIHHVTWVMSRWPFSQYQYRFHDFRWLFQVWALQCPQRPLESHGKLRIEAPHTEKSMENLNSFSCFNYDTISPSLTSPKFSAKFQRIRGKFIRFHRRQVTHAAQVIWCQSRIVLTDEENPSWHGDRWPIDRFFSHFKVDFIFPLKSKIAYIAYLKKGGGFRKKKIYSTPTPGFTFHWNAKHSPSRPLQRFFVGQRSYQPKSRDWCGSWSLVHNLSQFNALIQKFFLEGKQRPWVKLRLGSNCIIPPCFFRNLKKSSVIVIVFHH